MKDYPDHLGRVALRGTLSRNHHPRAPRRVACCPARAWVPRPLPCPAQGVPIGQALYLAPYSGRSALLRSVPGNTSGIEREVGVGARGVPHPKKPYAVRVSFPEGSDDPDAVLMFLSPVCFFWARSCRLPLRLERECSREKSTFFAALCVMLRRFLLLLGLQKKHAARCAALPE